MYTSPVIGVVTVGDGIERMMREEGEAIRVLRHDSESRFQWRWRLGVASVSRWHLSWDAKGPPQLGAYIVEVGSL